MQRDQDDGDEDKAGYFLAKAEKLTGLSLTSLGGWADPDDDGVDDEMREFILELTPEEREADNRRARLLAGVLWVSAIVMVDQLFEDIETLAELDEDPSPRDIDQTWVLSSLPERYAHRYNGQFARQFLTASVELFQGLGDSSGWSFPSCVAQELSVWCLLDQVEQAVGLFELDVAPHWQGELTEVLLEDLDSEMLFDRSLDGIEDDKLFAMDHGMASMSFGDWFKPFNRGSRLGPFTQE